MSFEWIAPGSGAWLGNTPMTWLVAGLVFLTTYTVLPIARRFLAGRRAAFASPPPWVELAGRLVERTSQWFLFTVAVFAAERVLTLPEPAERVLAGVIVVSFWLQVALWGTVALRFALDRQRGTPASADASRTASFEILFFIGRVALFALALLLALSNLGIEIGPLLAGLGVGGIAVALAVQTVLGDLFASISIALDKPFEVGDFLVIDAERGTVEHIGIKSTRLRSLTGEQVIIANADLLKSRVHNFRRMAERRYAFTIGVTYETPREKLVRIPGMLEAAIRAQPKTRFDRAHFTAFGDHALSFEAVYFVLDPQYQVFADAQQAINLHIMEAFEREGIEFAYPTRRQVVTGSLAVTIPPPAPGAAANT
jgi:small-conductance mechanosensitive channel